MEFLTAEEAAQYLRLHIDTVRKLLRQGALPGQKVGRQWRIPKRALEAWREAGESEDAHRARVEKALAEYRQNRGIEPDRHWRALLYLCTAVPSLWERVRPKLDFRHGVARLDSVQTETLSSGERVLLELAKALYAGSGAVDVADMTDTLDRNLFTVALTALREYRAGGPER